MRTTPKDVILACQHLGRSREYADAFVARLAQATGSAICAWFTPPADGLEPVAWTTEPGDRLDLLRASTVGVASEQVAAAPVTYHGVPVAVLAVAGRARGYEVADLGFLAECGRVAFLRWESLRAAEDLGVVSTDPAKNALIAVVHEVRQPLNTIATCAYLLEMLAADDAMVEHIALIQAEAERADQILADAVQRFNAASLRDSAAESRESTNSAMASVT